MEFVALRLLVLGGHCVQLVANELQFLGGLARVVVRMVAVSQVPNRVAKDLPRSRLSLICALFAMVDRMVDLVGHKLLVVVVLYVVVRQKQLRRSFALFGSCLLYTSPSPRD